jgi:hypothetical protein
MLRQHECYSGRRPIRWSFAICGMFCWRKSSERDRE